MTYSFHYVLPIAPGSNNFVHSMVVFSPSSVDTLYRLSAATEAGSFLA